jgi:hypothetical protein
VLAFERQPVGVGDAVVGLAPVEGGGGQVVLERQRRCAVGLGTRRAGHVLVEPVDVDA